MIYIVGSGPAGVSVATSLLNQGLRVTMLDAGVSLEPERQVIVSRLSQTPLESWARDDIELMKQGMAPSSSGVPLKYVYGSDFPYRHADTFSPLKRDGVDAAISFGRGGFSSVWGSAVLPYRARDITTWPISVTDLEPHYHAISRIMPISAVVDGLADMFPLYIEHPQSARASRQTTALLFDLMSREEALRKQGIFFGRSRVAIDAYRQESQSCTYCAMCMYGCPRQLIYSSATTLARMTGNPDFSYVPGVVVERVDESAGRVRIHGRSLADQTPQLFDGDRVYLACGPVSTSRILMTSTETYDTPVRMLDSQYFLMPLLRYKGTPDVSAEPLHTLAQAFVEIADDDVSERTVHLQIYTYNDMYERAVRGSLGAAHRVMNGPIAQIVSRMLIIQGFLHSDLSQKMDLVLERSNGRSPGALRMAAVTPAEPVDRTLGRITRKLASNRGAFRAIPVRPMLKIAGAGRGFHNGGTFPMTIDRTGTFQSDVLGRPAGFNRVHAVDSTIFPSIPATTITFTVMANAHRIGSLYNDS